MKIYLIMCFAVVSFVQVQGQCGSKINEKPKQEKTMTNEDVEYKDLPGNVKLTDEVLENELNEKGEVVSDKIITVKEKLQQLGAKYSDGKLVDKGGTEIKFYSPPVRGMSQGYDLDQKQQEIDKQELKDLKAKYTVIELYANRLTVM